MAGCVVTFGEAMLRLTTPDHRTISGSRQFDVTVGGAELNVAVALSRLGHPSRWMSALPANSLADIVLDDARAAGVDVSGVIRRDDARLGLYFLDNGTAPRFGSIVYDRKQSAFAQISSSDIAWDDVLKDASWFHTTGISLAVSASARRTTIDGMRAAKERGITVSFDPNFRSTMWSVADARSAFTEAVGMTDVLFANAEAMETFFRMQAVGESGMRAAARSLQLSALVYPTKREQGTREIAIGACALIDDAFVDVPSLDVEIVDRIGGGDAFAAGFIAGRLEQRSPADVLNLAVATSALAHTMPGDFLACRRDEVDRLASGEQGRSIRR